MGGLDPRLSLIPQLDAGRGSPKECDEAAQAAETPWLAVGYSRHAGPRPWRGAARSCSCRTGAAGFVDLQAPTLRRMTRAPGRQARCHASAGTPGPVSGGSCRLGTDDQSVCTATGPQLRTCAARRRPSTARFEPSPLHMGWLSEECGLKHAQVVLEWLAHAHRGNRGAACHRSVA